MTPDLPSTLIALIVVTLTLYTGVQVVDSAADFEAEMGEACSDEFGDAWTYAPNVTERRDDGVYCRHPNGSTRPVIVTIKG